MPHLFKHLPLYILSALPAISFAQSSAITGFKSANANAQLQLESRFDKQLQAQNIGAAIKTFSTDPHNIGSVAGKKYAEEIAARLKEFGFDTKIETYSVLFPIPKTRVLEMT